MRVWPLHLRLGSAIPEREFCWVRGMQELIVITLMKDLGALQIALYSAFHLRISEVGDVEHNLVLACLYV